MKNKKITSVRKNIPLNQMTAEEIEAIKQPRFNKIVVAKSGGNAGKESIQFRVTLPTPWCSLLGLGKDEREIVMVLREDKNEIAIIPKARYSALSDTEDADAGNQRIRKLQFTPYNRTPSGVSSGGGSYHIKMTISNSWCTSLGFNDEERDVAMVFRENKHEIAIIPLKYLPDDIAVENMKLRRLASVVYSDASGQATFRFRLSVAIPIPWAFALGFDGSDQDVVIECREDCHEIVIIPKKFYQQN